MTVDQITLVLRDGRGGPVGERGGSDAKARVLTSCSEEPAKVYDVSGPGQPTTR